MAQATEKGKSVEARTTPSFRRNLTTLNTVAACLVIAATSWFLLKELAGLLRLVACTLPILLAFLQLDLGWQPVAVACLLIALHTKTGNVIEPAMASRTVGLSPLVILVSLAF